MGIFDRLFGRAAKTTSAPMTDDEAIKIINAYGKAITDRKSQYGVYLSCHMRMDGSRRR
jgi:hypothetical protein